MRMPFQLKSLILSGVLASPLFMAAGCCPAKTVRSVDPVVEPAADVPAVLAWSDAGVETPESGFWERVGAGIWKYDLGVGLNSDIQLTTPGDGRGLMRVTLPPGAAGAKVTAIRVMYAKNHVDMAQTPGSASGTAVWHLHADDGGKPGAELGVVPVVVDDADAAPLEECNDGVTHTIANPIVVPATFWLVFERTSGDPRIAAMRLGESLQGTYADLFFIKDPTQLPGEPTLYRPYIGLSFVDLGAPSK